MHLVTTKPAVLCAESDTSISADTQALIAERLSRYQGCFVEIGSGSGMHLLQLAAQSPQHLCIGIELRYKRAFKTAEKAERDGLDNVLVIRTDARQIHALVPLHGVDGFFINYPDPWEKRRWHKNRILNATFVAQLRAALKPSGFLRYKTDHQEYFASATPLFSTPGWQIEKCTTDLTTSAWWHENIPSEFEGLFRSQGKPLCMLEASKQGA